MQDEIEGSLDRLSRDGGLPERERIIAPFERGVKALEEILELVADGRGADTDEASSRAATRSPWPTRRCRRRPGATGRTRSACSASPATARPP